MNKTLLLVGFIPSFLITLHVSYPVPLPFRTWSAAKPCTLSEEYFRKWPDTKIMNYEGEVRALKRSQPSKPSPLNPTGYLGVATTTPVESLRKKYLDEFASLLNDKAFSSYFNHHKTLKDQLLKDYKEKLQRPVSMRLCTADTASAEHRSFIKEVYSKQSSHYRNIHSVCQDTSKKLLDFLKHNPHQNSRTVQTIYTKLEELYGNAAVQMAQLGSTYNQDTTYYLEELDQDYAHTLQQVQQLIPSASTCNPINSAQVSSERQSQTYCFTGSASWRG